MLGTKCFHGDPDFHSCIPVGRYELIMIQLDNIRLYTGYNTCDSAQFTRFIRKLNGYSKDTIAQDQTFLYYRGHGDDIHISAT